MIAGHLNYRTFHFSMEFGTEFREQAGTFSGQMPVSQKALPGIQKWNNKKTITSKTDTLTAFPVLTRYQRWKEEQTLLIDTSRYIQPIQAHSYFVPEIKIRDLNLAGKERHFIQNDWLVAVLLLALIIFASIRSAYAKYLGHLMKSVFYYPAAIKMYSEKNYPLVHGAYRLEIYFHLVASAFIFQVVNTFSDGLGLNKYLLFLICFGLVLIYFQLKKTIYRVIGYVTEGRQEFSEIQFNLSNYYRVLGLMLFPFVALIGFLPMKEPHYMTFTGIGLMIFFYLLFLLRSGKILLRNRVSIHYLFLYLCTLEFLPLVLIGKLVLTS